MVGRKHIGIGSDFDGILSVPAGLEDASKYPYLVRALSLLSIETILSIDHRLPSLSAGAGPMTRSLLWQEVGVYSRSSVHPY
jgi:hypothetical protein